MLKIEETIGSIIRAGRLRKNLTQQNLADEFSLHPSAIGNIESDRLIPAESTLLKIAEFLEIPVGKQDHILRLKTKNEEKRKFTKAARIMGVKVETLSSVRSGADISTSKLSGYLREIENIAANHPNLHDDTEVSVGLLLDGLRARSERD